MPALEDVPGGPTIDGDLDVGVVEVLLDIVPGPEVEGRPPDPGEVELSGQGRVYGVAPVAPPLPLTAVGFVGQQLDEGETLEYDSGPFAPQPDLDVVRSVLANTILETPIGAYLPGNS